MTYKENSNLFLEGSGMPCLYHETKIVRNMDWEIGLQSTTYQQRDANYILDPSGITGNAKLMYSFTSPSVYYQVGTQVRYGDYIYFRARNLASANPYVWYLIEYCISTEDKIIFEVPDMGWYSYTIGQGAHFCPIAPRILLLYEPYDGFGTDIDYIRKIVFSGSTATMTTELQVQGIPDIIDKYIYFFDVVEGTDRHLYAVVFGNFEVLTGGDDPNQTGWLVYYKDMSTSYGE